ncbi:MAG TPA: excinuclease ABC subunit B [Lentisphaeria bacterium]|nr:excinuclease ABC subunit B [Lentisphaeria bacterium]
MTKPFKLHADFEPAGDQPAAIKALVNGLQSGRENLTLLGVTGSGKTFTLANMIEQVQRPAIILSHNKTLAAQLYSEFKGFFPNNSVGYFISYYDYYLPEAYIPQTDTYIAKDSHVNKEIEMLRLAATSSLMERRDVIIVASVSCIYGLGAPQDMDEMSVSLEADHELNRDELLQGLVNLQYSRNDVSPGRGEFRVTGDTVEVYPAYRDDYLRVEFWGDNVERITCRDAVTGSEKDEITSIRIFPASHFVLPEHRMKRAESLIIEEMKEQVKKFELEGRLVEAQRIFQRTQYDLEMMREVGFCSGIENYSRHLSQRAPGSRPYCLIDYFPDDYITIIDESHATIPQVRAMYNADRSRKLTLVDHGFRLPSALDNRPLSFDEFDDLTGQSIYVSATPGDYEIELSSPILQVVRPTGLLDPEVDLRPLDGQVDDLIAEVHAAAKRNERVLVTTLTKRTAEDLCDYLRDIDIRVSYLHSDIDAIERIDILRDLRAGKFDCLIGVNLLREGLDLPEVALVAILDADKEGFLRSERALVQTAGRAARNVDGRVILYADKMTDSLKAMMRLTNDRRKQQAKYNEQHGITPKTVKRAIQQSLHAYKEAEETEATIMSEVGEEFDVGQVTRELEAEMLEAAEKLEFERAALLRDQIATLRDSDGGTGEPRPSYSTKRRRVRY